MSTENGHVFFLMCMHKALQDFIEMSISSSYKNLSSLYQRKNKTDLDGKYLLENRSSQQSDFFLNKVSFEFP